MKKFIAVTTIVAILGVVFALSAGEKKQAEVIPINPNSVTVATH